MDIGDPGAEPRAVDCVLVPTARGKLARCYYAGIGDDGEGNALGNAVSYHAGFTAKLVHLVLDVCVEVACPPAVAELEDAFLDSLPPFDCFNV